MPEIASARRWFSLSTTFVNEWPRSKGYHMKLKTLFSLPYSLLFGYDIFISYTRDGSKDYARKLYDQLTSLDYSCFIDNKDVPGGRSLNTSLNAALKGSKTLI